MAAISTALVEAVAGRGSALAVEGEAGIGKSRLLTEARGLALETGAEVLAARAIELEGDFPFAVVRQLLEPRLRQLSASEEEALLEGADAALGALGLPADRDRSADTFAVLHALYWVVAGLAEQGPLLVAIDDAHLADPASLDWLAFILPRLDELPLLLVLAHRTDEPESPGLARILADPCLETVTPAPLSATATTRLIEARLGQQADDSFAAACHEITTGNPFLVTELARELADRAIDPRATQAELVRGLAPQRIAQRIMARVSRLSPDAAALARSIAIIGDGREPALAVELAGLNSEAGHAAADALRRASILDDGEALRFVHPLVCNAVYADLAAGERSKLHAAAAVLLRERGAAPEWVATQLLASEARGDRTAAETLLEAGRRGLADGAPRSAVTYLTRALREPPPPDLRIEILKTLLPAGLRAADHSALAAVEPELRTLLEQEPSSGRELAAPLTMGMALEGRLAEAAEVLQAAIQTAADESDVERLLQFEAQLRTLAILIPGLPEGDLRQYSNAVEPDSPAGRLAAAIEARAAVAAVEDGAARKAVEAAKRALGNDCAIFREESEMASATASVLILAIADEVEAATKAAGRALEIARERNATPDVSQGLFLRGFAAWSAGDLVAAESDVRQATELAGLAELGPLRLTFAGPLAEVLIERDELEGAEAIMAESGIGTGPIPPSGLFSFLMLARGHLRFERGEFTEAVEDFAALSQLGDSLGLGPGPMVLGSVFAARALVAIGRVDEARELTDPCLYHARRWGAPATISFALMGVAAARGGDEEIQLLREAVDILEDSPRRLQRAHALVDLGAALRRQNQRAEARPPLREGLKLARQCGAMRLAKRSREELQATGETVRHYAPIGVESLTPSERRVAEMAATGMTNRQIAQSLFVTLKTVEAHLTAAYDKLDISSRRELSGALQGT